MASKSNNFDSVVGLFASEAATWQATTGITPLATTISTLVKAAVPNYSIYITGVQAFNNAAAVSTLISLLDNATVIWTGYLPLTTATVPPSPIFFTLHVPLKVSAGQPLNLQLGTTAASVFYNLQGYIGL